MSDKETSLRELLSESSHYTLHSDRLLHLFLKNASTQLVNRTKSLEDAVREISMQADQCHVRLKNTFNQFLLLSDSQFIESRVYEEENEHLSKTVSEKKEKETTELSLPQMYRSALEMGLEAMKLFAIMDLESDTGLGSDTVLEEDGVVDIYNERPLPYIIGSQNFLEDETLGLGAAPVALEAIESESFSESEDSDSKSESDSHDEGRGIVAYEKESDSDNESGLFGYRPHPSSRGAFEERDSDEESTASNLFQVKQEIPRAKNVNDGNASKISDADTSKSAVVAKPLAVQEKNTSAVPLKKPYSSDEDTGSTLLFAKKPVSDSSDEDTGNTLPFARPPAAQESNSSAVPLKKAVAYSSDEDIGNTLNYSEKPISHASEPSSDEEETLFGKPKTVTPSPIVWSDSDDSDEDPHSLFHGKDASSGEKTVKQSPSTSTPARDDHEIKTKHNLLSLESDSDEETLFGRKPL